jgi:hypothetical protein
MWLLELSRLGKIHVGRGQGGRGRREPFGVRCDHPAYFSEDRGRQELHVLDLILREVSPLCVRCLAVDLLASFQDLRKENMLERCTIDMKTRTCQECSYHVLRTFLALVINNVDNYVTLRLLAQITPQNTRKSLKTLLKSGKQTMSENNRQKKIDTPTHI